MKNLEEQCLKKLNNILYKFDLKIDIVNISSIECQYRLINNNILFKNNYSNWLYLWLSISDILMHRNNSIFIFLGSHYNVFTNYRSSLNYTSDKYLFKVQKCAKAYKAIQYLENISCLEEFLIKCDLMGI